MELLLGSSLDDDDDDRDDDDDDNMCVPANERTNGLYRDHTARRVHA